MLEQVNHVGVSGGKDSVALLLWAVFHSGYPLESIDATFCDTGNEAPATIEHVAMISERVFPIRTLKPKLGFFDLAKKKGRFPSAKARFCTKALKIDPTFEHVSELLTNGKAVCLHSGVRGDESPARSKLPEFDYDGTMLCQVRRPLIRWTLEDVLAIHRKHGIPLNPLYALGASRVGCFPCIMSRKREIAMAARHFPQVIDRIRTAEREIGSTFFVAKTVRPSFRSGRWTSRAGKEHAVATIDDVVSWSSTEWGAQQHALFPDFQYDQRLASCQAGAGWCE